MLFTVRYRYRYRGCPVRVLVDDWLVRFYWFGLSVHSSLVQDHWFIILSTCQRQFMSPTCILGIISPLHHFTEISYHMIMISTTTNIRIYNSYINFRKTCKIIIAPRILINLFNEIFITYYGRSIKAHPLNRKYAQYDRINTFTMNHVSGTRCGLDLQAWPSLRNVLIPLVMLRLMPTGRSSKFFRVKNTCKLFDDETGCGP